MKGGNGCEMGHTEQGRAWVLGYSITKDPKSIPNQAAFDEYPASDIS